MANTTHLTIDQARERAVVVTQTYLRQHGASICDLLDAFDDPGKFATLCDLHAAFAQPFPDPDAVRAALNSILRVLAEVAPSTYERVGVARNLPASDMARWHGARISELLAQFDYDS